MAKSQQTFNKNEKEKKRLKKREEKKKKMEARKLEKETNGSKGIQFAYVDHNGNLTDTPPDPLHKINVEAESIEITIPKKQDNEPEEDPIKKGKVAFFNDAKGYGFVSDNETNEKYFVHISDTIDQIKEGNQVTFELEKGKRGLNAVRVKLS